MKKIAKLLGILLIPSICHSQNAADLIGRIKDQQQSITTLSYHMNRTDTLGTFVRQMTGTAVMEKNVKDSIFGFNFWGQKEGDPIAKMYDGHIGYAIDMVAKQYEITTSTSGFHNLLNGGGGHLILPDLMNLDTSGVFKTTLSEEETTYLLVFQYPDITQYDITKKFKAVKIVSSPKNS